jgi:hypothetical protein
MPPTGDRRAGPGPTRAQRNPPPDLGKARHPSDLPSAGTSPCPAKAAPSPFRPRLHLRLSARAAPSPIRRGPHPLPFRPGCRLLLHPLPPGERVGVMVGLAAHMGHPVDAGTPLHHWDARGGCQRRPAVAFRKNAKRPERWPASSFTTHDRSVHRLGPSHPCPGRARELCPPLSRHSRPGRDQGAVKIGLETIKAASRHRAAWAASRQRVPWAASRPCRPGSRSGILLGQAP